MSEKLIREMKDYLLEGTGKVTTYTAIDRDLASRLNEKEVLYSGFLVVAASTERGDVLQVPLEFKIDANSLEESFEVFDTFARAKFEELKEEHKKQKENKIVVPNSQLVAE